LVNLSSLIFRWGFRWCKSSALCPGGVSLLTWLPSLFGERLFQLRIGFLFWMALAHVFLFPQLSRWMMLDSLFTLLFLLDPFDFLPVALSGGNWRRDYLLAAFSWRLGVLTKGPIAYLPVPIFWFSRAPEGTKKFWNLNLLYGFLIS